VIGGSACGALRPGVHYRSISRESASQVLLSLIRSMDIVQAEFGMDDARVSNGLSAIEA
jgi:hypothetical protein